MGYSSGKSFEVLLHLHDLTRSPRWLALTWLWILYDIKVKCIYCGINFCIKLTLWCCWNVLHKLDLGMITSWYYDISEYDLPNQLGSWKGDDNVSTWRWLFLCGRWWCAVYPSLYLTLPLRKFCIENHVRVKPQGYLPCWRETCPRESVKEFCSRILIRFR